MPRPIRPWFRFYVEAFPDRKIRRLKPAQRWVWVAVLGAARESHEPGKLYVAPGLPMSVRELADYAAVTEKEARAALDGMLRLSMITVVDDLITVTNWDRRQFESDNVTERTRDHRERSKEPRRNVPKNGRRNTPERTRAFATETETETEQPTTDVVGADKPPRAELAVIVEEPTAQTLVAEWIDHCARRPPGNVIGQVSKQIKTMLGEDISPDRIRAALVEWNTKGLHPSTLPSVVHEQANRKPRAGSSRNDDFRAMQERQMARAIEAERKMGLR